MTKKKGIFDIQIEQPLFPVRKQPEKRNDLQIEQALTVVLKQLEVGGCRERTLYDYRTIVHYFTRDTKVEYLVDITNDIIYLWLGKIDVANMNKLTRLKCFKAFLGRCFDNVWLANRFWRSVNIKVDTEIKVGATDEDVNLLLSVLDYTKFIDLRNAAANLLMYRCGLRIGTIARMKEQHVDFDNQRYN